MVRKLADTHIYISGNEEVPEGQTDCVHTNIKKFLSAKPHCISQESADMQQSIHILLVQSSLVSSVFEDSCSFRSPQPVFPPLFI